MTRPIVCAVGDLPASAVLALEPHCQLIQCGRATLDTPAMQRRLREADAMLIKGGQPVVAAMLTGGEPAPKIIANIGVGYNNIDVDACRARGVLVTNTPEVLDDTVADLVLGLLLCATRRICELDRWIRSRAWNGPATPEIFGMDLSGTTLGIVGMGRIGEAVARRARLGFGMNIVYYNRSARPRAEKEFGARLASLPDLLGLSDHVVLLAPYSKSTHQLFGAREFALMKSSATFVNASRGQLVDEAALIEALKGGVIRAAGLDVFEHEPLASDNPLLAMTNVTLTPHVGSATILTRTNMALRAADNVIAALSGNTPRDLVPELKDAS